MRSLRIGPLPNSNLRAEGRVLLTLGCNRC